MEDSNNRNNKRDKWSKQVDFVMSCVGFAVGLGNIWRFPYLCYKNGGGAFFIPYFIMLFCGGIPIFVLEVGLGQYMSKGGLHAFDISPLFKGAFFIPYFIMLFCGGIPIFVLEAGLGQYMSKGGLHAFDINPPFKGIGIATTVIVFLMNIYYIIILAWAIFYFVMSLTTTLPWSQCNNQWNTIRCVSGPITNSSCTGNNCTGNQTVDSTVEFWERRVLQISDGIDHPDGLVWELAVSLLVAWVVVYFCVWRGIKWTGKVVYFTATFPYVVLVVLLIRAVTLDGAVNGIIYYLKPDFSKLADPQVWIDGGTQIFFSYAIALGCMITLGSYNKFHNNFYRQCAIIATINSGTSILGGFVVFSVLGFMAAQQNVDISAVANAGPGLAFITYPKAVTQMPAAPVWSALFFFMIFLVGIDSQFVGVEGVLTNIVDTFPHWFGKPKGRSIMVAVYCIISYLIGLCMVSRGGMYIFQLFDYYSASGMVLLYICFLESILIGWSFGAEQFCDVIELMIGYRINRWFYICWKFVTPALTLGILLFQAISFKELVYNKTYIYPAWGQVFGIMLAVVSMICVPVYCVLKMLSSKGTLIERIRCSKTPLLESYQIPDKWRKNEQHMKWTSKYPQDEAEMHLTKV